MEPTIASEPSDESKTDAICGIVLAVLSSVFIGSSFILKKKSLLRLNSEGAIRAGDGGYGYLKDKLWWMGLLLMAIGELANFVAYGFAPASLVTPLGALSILVSSILAVKYLKENLNDIRLMGFFLCILGSTILVIHAPKEEEITSLEELSNRIQHSGFITYLVVVTVICLIIFCYVGPQYGNTHILVYITFCSAVGSVSVMACKGLALALRFGIGSDDKSYGLLTVTLFILVAFCISLQMNYLNKALDIFSTSSVTPVYYVLFTSLVLLSSGILFDEWKNLSGGEIVSCLCGFLTTVIAIYVICKYKDRYIAASQVKTYGTSA